ncbi:acyl-CoA synthetase [Porticoccus sp. GXU_MW_L64]
MNSATAFRFTKPSDVCELEKTPFDERDLPHSTYELLRASAEAFADKTALSFLPEGSAQEKAVRYSFRELFARITQVANALNHLGVKKDNAVSMLLPNLPQTHFALWGGEAAGIINPINPLLNAEYIASIMAETKASVLITLAPFPGSDIWDKTVQVANKVPGLKTILAVDITPLLSTEDAQVATTNHREHLNPLGNCQVLDFDDFVAGFNDQQLDSQRVISPQDIASYFHTGGTTGAPKLVPHTHHNEIAMAWQIIVVNDLSSDMVALCGLPMFHVNAIFVTGLAPWLAGVEVLLAGVNGYRSQALIRDFWALVDKYQVSYFSAVPTILSALLETDSKPFNLDSLLFCVCGAAPLSVELASSFEARTGLVLIEGYGQTEGCCASTVNPRYGERRTGSVGGRLPYMQLRTVILDNAGNFLRDCDTDETGCICIKGPTVFSGYTQPEHNQGLWLEDGWFLSGDMGRLDEDGYLWLTGRSKDLIIRGGHNIDPQIIEEALHKHPGVTAVAAVGKPDVRVGEVPVAYVQLASSAQACEQELLEFAAQHIHERAAVPKEVFILDALPVTAVGKIFKPDLRMDAIERVIRAELSDQEGFSDDCFTLSVATSKTHGQVVVIELDDSLRPAAHECLSPYAFQYKFYPA